MFRESCTIQESSCLNACLEMNACLELFESQKNQSLLSLCHE